MFANEIQVMGGFNYVSVLAKIKDTDKYGCMNIGNLSSNIYKHGFIYQNTSR